MPGYDDDIFEYQQDLEKKEDLWEKEIEDNREKIWGFILALRLFYISLGVMISALILGEIFSLLWLTVIGYLAAAISVILGTLAFGSALFQLIQTIMQIFHW